MDDRVKKLKDKLKSTSNYIRRADILNQLAWELRYENTKEALELSSKALTMSQELGYDRGIAYGKLHQAVANFLLSREINVVHYLLDALEYFESSGKKETGMAICLNFLGRVYESLCVFNNKTNELEYSGAYNSLYHIRNGELKEIAADRMPIAIHRKDESTFTNKRLQIEDGYADQFGGPEGKKFKYKKLKNLLLSIQDHSMEKQKNIVEEEFDKWKGECDQIDDVILMGIRF